MTNAAQGVLAQQRAEVSAANLKVVLEKLIPEVAQKGYGALRIRYRRLLEPEKAQMKSMGYRLRYISGGEYGYDTLRIAWAPRRGRRSCIEDDDKSLTQKLPTEAVDKKEEKTQEA